MDDGSAREAPGRQSTRGPRQLDPAPSTLPVGGGQGQEEQRPGRPLVEGGRRGGVGGPSQSPRPHGSGPCWPPLRRAQYPAGRQKKLQKCLLTDSRTDPPPPLPHALSARPGVRQRDSAAGHAQSHRKARPSPAPGSGTRSSKGLPPPEGHPRPSWAGSWENSAQSGKGRHLTQP